MNSPPQPEPSRSLQLNERQKTNPKPKPSRSLHLNEILKKKEKHVAFYIFFWLHFHSQDLPEPYTSIRPKRTPENITPEWMRYKRGKPCGVLTFLWISFHSQNVPEHTPQGNRIEKKHEKHVAFSVFFDFISTARTFQKPTAAWEAKNEPTAKSFQKPTPEWDIIKKKEPCCVLPFSFWVHFRSQDLPEPYTSIRPKRTRENITPEWMRYKQ